MAAKSAKTKKHTAPKKTKPTASKKAVTTLSTPIVYAPLPTVLQLTRQTGRLLWVQRGVLSGITVVYGLLSLLLVRGLGAGVDVAQLRDQLSNQVAGSFAAYVQLLGNTADSTNPSAGSYQLILFIIATLALVWALRRVTAGERVSVKDAYYRGMHPLIPFVLVVLVIALQLLPALIGMSVYQLVVLTGIAATGFEVVLWGLGALVLALVSMYLVVPSIMALYIVTLPGMTPILALRTARRLVKGRRWTVLRKMLFFPVVALLAAGIGMVPFILIVPVVAGWLLFALGFVGVATGHVYFYNLYQRLLHEQQAT